MLSLFGQTLSLFGQTICPGLRTVCLKRLQGEERENIFPVEGGEEASTESYLRTSRLSHFLRFWGILFSLFWNV